MVQSPDPIVRSCASYVLAAKQKDKARKIILTFLNDPDDHVRPSLMDDIKHWPDAGTIYQKYIQAHDGDSNYKESVQSARDCAVLNRIIL